MRHLPCAPALHEVGIVGVTQDDNDQYYDNENDDSSTNEDPDNSPGISLEPAAARGKIAGVPLENIVELTGVTPPENKVDDDVVPPLLPIEYEINDECNDKDEDTYPPTQHH